MQSLSAQRSKLLFISPEILATVVFFAAGICWAEALRPSAWFLLFNIFSLLVLLYIVHKINPQKHKVITCSILGILFFLLGLQHAKIYLNPPADSAHIYNLIKVRQSASLDCILQKYPSVTYTAAGPETRLLVKAKTIYTPAGLKAQMLKSSRTTGLVLLTLKGLLSKELEPGNHILVKTDLSRVNTFSTPGSFNYKKYLASQAVFIRGWIQSPANIIKRYTVEASHPAAALNALKYLPERIRCHISEFLNQTLKQPARGLYKAILIGDRNDVPPAVIENFTGAGCMHILAISGMHMGLLALVTIAVLTWILKRSTWLLLQAPVLKIAVALALLPLLIYALIAGLNTPVLRALLMTTVFILAILFDRPGNLINHILLAAFFILAWKPGAIFTASFQLSFSAVVAIALIYPILYRLFFQEKTQALSTLSTNPGLKITTSSSSEMRRIPATFIYWILTGVALTTAAMLGTFPLLLFHFNRLSLVAPISNLLVEPLICFWSLILGLFASLCIPFLPTLAKILFLAGSFGLITAERTCAYFTSLPYAALWLPNPSPFEIIIIYITLLSFVAALHLAARQRLFALITALLSLCFLVAETAVTTTLKNSSGSTSVTFLDVGHGSSILLQLPDNKNILIDGGGAESERFDIGERVIGPFLWNQKLRRLDTVVITHPHADHYNGLPFILNRFHPKELWINGITTPDPEYSKLLNLAGRLGIKTKIAKTDDILFQAGPTRLLCIHSGLAPAYQTENTHKQYRPGNPNDYSIVLRLETAGKSFLFPADISGKMAENLVKARRPIQADVLLAPHHGSPSSLSRDFIETVAPEYLAISAGRNNPFNLPTEPVYDLQQKGIKILSTGRDGTITFNIKNGKIMTSSYQVN